MPLRKTLHQMTYRERQRCLDAIRSVVEERGGIVIRHFPRWDELSTDGTSVTLTDSEGSVVTPIEESSNSILQYIEDSVNEDSVTYTE